MHQLEWWECPRLTPARCLRQRAPPCEGGRGQKPKAKEKCADFALCRLLRVSKFMWSAWPKKKDACALPDLFGSPFLDAPMCASKRLTVFLPCRYLLRRLLLPLCPTKKKKKRMKIAYELQLLRRLNVGNGRTRCYFLAELLLLTVMDWRLKWWFLVGFCVA